MNDQFRDLGLLVLRAGSGLSMAIFHGWGKINGGVEMWAKLGANMGPFGLGLPHAFWGFMAAFAEFACSLLLILGIWFRPAAVLLAATMLVAAKVHLGMEPGSPNAGWKGASHALELLTVYVALFLTGPGKLVLKLKKD